MTCTMQSNFTSIHAADDYASGYAMLPNSAKPDDVEQAKANQQTLKNFYSVIKDSDPYLEFMLITGVSKFSKVSVFSDLNRLCWCLSDKKKPV